MRLVLASSSPRRAEILRNAGFTFSISPPGLDETPFPGESPQQLVERLAGAKADLAAAGTRDPAIIIAADTTVALGDLSFGKPASPDEACRMLEELAGRSHRILTGVSVLRTSDRRRRDFTESTTVHFGEIPAEEISRYVATGEPFDKAGGYGIQGYASRYVSRVEGCYFNILGLPIFRVVSALNELGWSGAT